MSKSGSFSSLLCCNEVYINIGFCIVITCNLLWRNIAERKGNLYNIVKRNVIDTYFVCIVIKLVIHIFEYLSMKKLRQKLSTAQKKWVFLVLSKSQWGQAFRGKRLKSKGLPVSFYRTSVPLNSQWQPPPSFTLQCLPRVSFNAKDHAQEDQSFLYPPTQTPVNSLLYSVFPWYIPRLSFVLHLNSQHTFI